VHGFLHSAGQRIEILRWHECGTEDTFIQFHDGLSAVSFLREFMNDPMNMATLRRELLGLLQNSTDISRLTDHQILQQLSNQIAHGYVRLVLKEDRPLQVGDEIGSSREAVETEETPSEAEAAASVRTTSEPPPVQEIQPAVTPSESHEPTREIEVEEEPQPVELEPLILVGAVAAQAATMTQAAQNGHPFCDT